MVCTDNRLNRGGEEEMEAANKKKKKVVKVDANKVKTLAKKTVKKKGK